MAETKQQLIERLRKRADEFEANRRAGKVFPIEKLGF